MQFWGDQNTHTVPKSKTHPPNPGTVEAFWNQRKAIQRASPGIKINLLMASQIGSLT